MNENGENRAGKISRNTLFLVFLTALNILSMIDRQLLASFANFIVPDLGLTNTQFGLLNGLLFVVFYSVAGIFMGVLADTVNRTRLIAVGLILWSALTAVSGAAKGFVSLAIPRMFIGVGESILTPSAMSLLADRFDSSRLGFASGFYYMGAPLGAGLSMLIAGYLGPMIGWRMCFYALGAIGLVLAVSMWFVPETPRKHLQDKAPDDGTAIPGFKEIIAITLSTLRRSPALVLTLAGGVFFHFTLGAAAFDQLWMVNERGFDRAEILQQMGWIGIVAGISGNLFGGIGSDWFMRKTGLGRPMFLFWIMLVLAPISIGFRVSAPDSIFFWAGIFFGFFQIGAFYGPTFATLQELVPPQIRSTIVAFNILLLNLLGIALGITVAGIVVDVLIARGVEQPYSIVLLGFVLISLLAIPCFLVAGLRFTRDRDALYQSMNAKLDEEAA